MARRRNWTDKEQRVAIRAYLFLLHEQQAGRKVNKAALTRAVLPHLENRTRGSYEMKLMNISSAMNHNGFETVVGYKAYGHAQKSITAILIQEMVDESWRTVYNRPATAEAKAA